MRSVVVAWDATGPRDRILRFCEAMEPPVVSYGLYLPSSSRVPSWLGNSSPVQCLCASPAALDFVFRQFLTSQLGMTAPVSWRTRCLSHGRYWLARWTCQSSEPQGSANSATPYSTCSGHSSKSNLNATEKIRRPSRSSGTSAVYDCTLCEHRVKGHRRLEVYQLLRIRVH